MDSLAKIQHDWLDAADVERTLRIAGASVEMIECSLSAIALVDITGRLIHPNAQLHRISGYQRGELDGRTVYDLMSPEIQEIHHLDSRIETEMTAERDPERPTIRQICCAELIRRDGSPLRMVLHIVRFTRGVADGFLGIQFRPIRVANGEDVDSHAPGCRFEKGGTWPPTI